MMKQHITLEQLNELSDNGKEKYADFCSKSLKIVIRKKVTYGDGMIKKTVEWDLPRLSIGQMIEFLGNGWAKLTLEAWEKPMGPLAKCPPPWATDVLERILGEDVICDNLWEAVKVKLNKR